MSTSVSSLLAQSNESIRLLEAHDSNCVEIIRRGCGDNGESFQGVWISGLTQTTSLGFPDTELLSPLLRASLIADFHIGSHQSNSHRLCAAFDADSGGPIKEIAALVALLARMHISMVVIEDKSVYEPGTKVNSLKKASSSQSQANMFEFANTIREFKSASAKYDIMITARIETFTVRVTKEDDAEDQESIRQALEDALARAKVYKKAGADAIMIHSKSEHPYEVLSFLKEYRYFDILTPLVVVPTTYSRCTERTLRKAGANVIIYANHLMRAKIRAMGEFSDSFLAGRPNLFQKDPELRTCLEVRNFGCLSRIILFQGKSDKEMEQYRRVAEKKATENMKAVVKCLLDGKMSSAADARIISLQELLQINARPIQSLETICTGMKKV